MEDIRRLAVTWEKSRGLAVSILHRGNTAPD
jgi:hypothetical protein